MSDIIYYFGYDIAWLGMMPPPRPWPTKDFGGRGPGLRLAMALKYPPFPTLFTYFFLNTIKLKNIKNRI